MRRMLPDSIFGRILLATLLPLILIFSVVIATIGRSVFQASAGTAREKTLSFARQSAEQVRSSILRTSGLAELTARNLALVADDSEQARETALEMVTHTMEKTPNAYRFRMYFDPGEDAFGTDGVFSRIFYHENGKVTAQPFLWEDEPDLDLSSPWYEVPLKQGVPFHDSVARGRFGLNKGPTYAASTNYPVICNGKVIGCIGIGMLYQKSFQFVDKWEEDGSYRLLIVSEAGTVLYASDAGLIERNIDSLGFEADFLDDMQNAMRENTSLIRESYSPVFKKKSLICVYPVDLPGTAARIFMYMDTPTELVYGGAYTSVRKVLATFLLGLLFFLGCLFAATKTIVQPIRRITEKADRIANGKLDAFPDSFNENGHSKNEVDRLERSLHMMLKELAATHEVMLLAREAEYEKKRVEEESAAKDRFFANMSHEIRTPMSVILGLAEVLLADDLTTVQKKHVHNIKMSSESLLDIINDILDLSRMESGNLPLQPVHYDLKMLIENIRSLSQYLAEKKGLEFRCDTGGDMPEVLYGDDVRLRQVLLNVIGNAIKYTEQGSVTLKLINEGETLRFDVTDTGIGIRNEDVPNLFDPFKQADEVQNRRVKGTGLGLAICHNLVELMGGSITIDSEYGKGTTFHVVIPKVLGEKDQIEQSTEVLPTVFDPGARVLVVDDSEVNLNVARELLKLFGIVIDTALSGAEAIEKIKESDYDLVFMDHMMPEMNGVETTKRIRSLGGRFAKMPIVALTANVVIGSQEMYLSSGMDDFLAKPVEKLKLQAMLAKWMPENLVLRESRYGAGSRYRFRSAVMTAQRNEASVSSRPSRILDMAAELEELDIELGLSRVADNREVYEDQLGLVAESVPKTLEKIKASGEDKEKLVVELHGLKGTLANLGAMGLSNRASELEQGIHEMKSELFARKLERLCQSLKSFVRKLREILSKKEDKKKRIMPPKGKKLKDGLNKLRNALADFDYQKSLDMIESIAQYDWGETHNQRIDTIHMYVKSFDYDAAMGELERVFLEIGKKK